MENESVEQKRPNSVPNPDEHLANVRLGGSLSLKALFARISFVVQGRAKGFQKWNELYSSEEPNTKAEALWERCFLPPEDMLEELLRAKVPKNAKSLTDWDEESIRYDLSAIEIYRSCDRACKTRALWRKAQKWMDEWTNRTDGMRDTSFITEKLAGTLEWDVHIRTVGPGVHTNELIGLLSDEWLTDGHIDLILRVLIDRQRNSERPPEAIIAPCMFISHVRNMYETRKDKYPLTARVVERYRDDFLKGRCKVLYFVALMNQNHWVAWKIDYTAGTLSHGE